MRLSRTLTAILVALPFGAMAEEHHHGPPPGGGDGGRQNPPPGGDNGGHQGLPMGMMLERLEQIVSIVESKDGDKEAAEKLAKWEEELKDKPEFKKLDTDGDGHISRDEAKAAAERFQAMLKEKQPEVFAKMDANGDGKLSRDEIHAALEKWRQEHPQGDRPGKHGGDEGGGDDAPKPRGDDPDAGQDRPK